VGSLPKGFVLPSFNNWRVLPRLPTADFNQLLGRSRVLVYFSEYEGFGMPPIEALLHGAAPVYSRIPAMIETSAGLGFPFANDDYASFAAALDAALLCHASQIGAWAASLTARHTWAAAAERIATILSNLGP
jgi:glycosyltransferase involved in cell wall biosynthesis